MKMYQIQIEREDADGKIVTENHFVTATSMLVVVDAFKTDMLEDMSEVISIVKHVDVSQNLVDKAEDGGWQ